MGDKNMNKWTGAPLPVEPVNFERVEFRYADGGYRCSVPGERSGVYVPLSELARIGRILVATLDAWSACGACADPDMTIDMNYQIERVSQILRGIDRAFNPSEGGGKS